MANEFNFKKNLKVYLHTAATGYLPLDVSEDVSFGQTFANSSYPTKTIHATHFLHQRGNIKKANPANFNFTIPLLEENDLKPVFDRLVQFQSSTNTLQTFDLYFRYPDSVDTDDVFKIETCVITEGLFIINQAQPLSLTVSGQGSKLSRISGMPSGFSEASRSSTRTFQPLNFFEVKILNNAIQKGVSSVSLELQNDIEWINNTSVHAGVLTTGLSNTTYPTGFSLKERKLGGSLVVYVDDESSVTNQVIQGWDLSTITTSSHTSLFEIKAGSKSDFSKGIKFVVDTRDEITNTRRVTSEQLMIYNIDFSYAAVGSLNLNNIIKYNTT